MTWRDQLLPGSFRGAAFSVMRSSAAFGRRVVLHEYPLRDRPYAEDLGRRARTMRVEAILVGADYRAARDALIEAIEQAGPGKLVHPYYGELTVTLDDTPASIEETSDQGGAAFISFSCVEAGDARFPQASAATSDQVIARADAAGDVAGDGLAESLDLQGAPGFVSASALAQVTAGLDLLQSALAGAAAGDARSLAVGLIAELRPELLTLLAQPSVLYGRLRDAYALARDAFAPEDGLRAFVLASRELPLVPLPATPTTPQRAIERDTCVLLIDTVRTLIVCQAAVCAADVVFPDYPSAIEGRDALVEQLDRVSEITTDDRLHQALADLRAAVVRDINRRAAELARVVSYTTAGTVPAVVVAYRLYTDAAREQEIVDRNRLPHPGFISGGRTLEVLDVT